MELALPLCQHRGYNGSLRDTLGGRHGHRTLDPGPVLEILHLIHHEHSGSYYVFLLQCTIDKRRTHVESLQTAETSLLAHCESYQRYLLTAQTPLPEHPVQIQHPQSILRGVCQRHYLHNIRTGSDRLLIHFRQRFRRGSTLEIMERQDDLGPLTLQQGLVLLLQIDVREDIDVHIGGSGQNGLLIQSAAAFYTSGDQRYPGLAEKLPHLILSQSAQIHAYLSDQIGELPAVLLTTLQCLPAGIQTEITYAYANH